jgi:ribosome biogenesis GTPase
VTEVHRSRCRVRLDGGGVAECDIAGRLTQGRRVQRNVLVVGDRVRLRAISDTPVVEEVLPRRNELGRRAPNRPGLRHVIAANIDLAIIVVSARRPELRTGFVDRLLVAASVRDIPAMVVVNKIDLVEPDETDIADIVGVYTSVGIEVVRVSALTGEFISELRERLRDRVSVFVGPSGAGKSSLLNAVQPGLHLNTGEVSDATNKGKHTTTTSSLLALDGDGFVVDTPGVRAFGIEEIGATEIAAAYPEFTSRRGACRFSACTHVHEPACAIRAAVDAGEIVEWRYENYVRIVETADADEG